jgi:hypothetical protein
MRLEARIKMGYYPTPLSVIDRIKTFISSGSAQKVSLFDPCCGEGLALARLAEGFDAKIETYGVELDQHRADEATTRLDHILHCGIEETRISHRCFSLMMLNPPYDWEDVNRRNTEDLPSERKEKVFLQNTVKYLRPGGLLIYIVPQKRLSKSVARILAYRFERFSIYRFPDGEYERFEQMVLLAVKKTNAEMDDKTCRELTSIPRRSLNVMNLSDEPVYQLPPSVEVKSFLSTRIDPAELEREVRDSPVWKRFKESTRKDQWKMERPPLPLHTGHLGLLLASGLLDGVIGNDEDKHVVRGKVEKVTTTFEQVKDDCLEQRELESFRVSIKILKKNGEIMSLV